MLKMLGAGLFGRINTMLGASVPFPSASIYRRGTDTYKDELLKLHPFPPALVPNFTRQLGNRLRHDAPSELDSAENIGLLDAGAFCNIPYLPLCVSRSFK